MPAENQRLLTLLKASAGSGKTYNLAINYLALALQEQDHFRHILAITFTNKATREMKERILSFLVKTAQNEDENLIKQIAIKAALPSDEIIRRAKIELKNILHNYSHFSIKTIDSFNQKILRSFAREIGLLGNFKLELDTQKVLDTAISQMIEQSNENPEIKQWMVNFSRDKMEEGQSWDISKDLKNLSSELYNEQFKILEAIDPQIITATSNLKDFIAALKKIKVGFEQRMLTIGQQASEIINNHHLGPSDFFQSSRGVYQYFINIQQPIDKYAPNSYVLKCLDDPEKWPSSKTPHKDQIIDLTQNELLPLLEQAVSLYQQEFMEYSTVTAISKNIYALGLFSEIKKAIDQYKIDTDSFLLSDTNIFLRGIIQDNETPFIYEKTGSWYYHFLIDEFQDTSQLQWENLKPLVVNSLDEENHNLIVGDAKQSIYRWRGGDWELIEKEINKSIGEERIEVQNLDTNWRSSKEVIAFNNALFEALPKNFQKLYRQESPELFEELSQDFTSLYSNASQLIGNPANDQHGYVEINLIDKDEEDGALHRLRNQLETLQDSGYKLSDIAILTRTKSEGVEIIEYLNQLNKEESSYRFNTVSNESLLIKNHPTIRLIVNGLQYIKDPDNDLFLANIAIEYFNEIKNPEKLNQLLAKTEFKKEFLSLFPSEFIMELDQYQRYGLLESVSNFIRVFELDNKYENAPYLMAFQDIVQNFISDYGNDVFSFLNWWDENKGRQALQSTENLDAIRIMTIHKSKGLEFEAVIIPFCNWNIDHSGKNNVYLWCINESESYPQQKVVPLKYVKVLEESQFANEYFDEKHRAYIDNLNLCYVAFTRAKNVLMINTDKTPPSSKSKTISKLLQQTLEAPYFVEQMEASDDQYTLGQLPTRISQEIQKSDTPEKFKINSWRNRIQLKKRGKELLKKSEKGRIERINYGIIVHEVLSQIKDQTEISPFLIQYQLQGIITRDEVSHITEQTDAIFSNPTVAEWFDTSWEVKNEQSILSPNNEEMRPDRVMFKDDQVVIVDFKTGKELPEHTAQLKRYRDKLKEMGHQNIRAFVLYISTNKVKEIA